MEKDSLTIKSVPVKVVDILDLINCAEDYGFSDSVLMATFAEWLGDELLDEDIESYASDYLSPEMQEHGYGEEDYENAKELLNEFRDQYIKSNNE